MGFIPALVSMYLERQVGEKIARDLLLTGRILMPHEARALGLVTRVVPAGELLSAAREIGAQLLIANSPGELWPRPSGCLCGRRRAEIDRRIEMAIAESVAIRATPDFARASRRFSKTQAALDAGRSRA